MENQKIVDIERIYNKCQHCHSYDWWVSIYGKVFCMYCHPAASSELILYLIQSREDLEVWEKLEIEKERALYKIKKND